MRGPKGGLTQGALAAAWVVSGLLIGALVQVQVQVQAQELSGRVKLSGSFTPFYGLLTPQSPPQRLVQTTAERVPQLVGVVTQIDLGLDFPGVGLDGTFVLSPLGLTLAWLSGDFSFLAREEGPVRAVQKRTLAQNDFVKVLRAFPARVPAGGTVEVLLVVEALQDLTGAPLTITEEYPSGWAVEFVDPQGALVAPNVARWTVALGLPGSRAVIRYSVRVPEGARGLVAIGGTIESALFPPLSFDDTIEVIPPAPPTLPGRVRIRQDVLFSALIANNTLIDPLGFRLLTLRTRLTPQPGLTLSNFLRIQNVGTAQTPAFQWRDVVQISGQTAGGVNVRATLRFADDGDAGVPLLFDGGTLQISVLPITSQLSLRLLASFDAQNAVRLQAVPGWTTELGGTQVRAQGNFRVNAQLQIEEFTASLRLLNEFSDGLLQLQDLYGPLAYDATPDDGVEEEHFELTRRTVLLRFTLGKLDVQAISVLRPVLADGDSDGADEKLASAKLVQQEIRVRRAFEDVLIGVRALYTASPTTPPPDVLQLSLLHTELTVIRGPLRSEADLRLFLNPLAFQTTFSLTVSF